MISSAIPRSAAPISQEARLMRGLMYVFVVLAMCIFTSILQKFFGHQALMAGLSDQVVTLVSYGCLVAAAICAGVQRLEARRMFALWLPMVAFVTASVLWSPVADDTLRKVISWSLLLFGMSLFCAAHTRGVLERVLGLLAIVASLGSFVTDLIAPGITHAFANNMFVGIFIHKSFLADACSFGGLVALYHALEKRSVFWMLIFAGCVAGVAMAETWSAIFGMGLGVFVLVSRRFIRTIFLACWGLSVSLPLFNQLIPANLIVDYLGRDMTFSGRIYLWDYAFQAMDGRILLGSGFNNIGNMPAWDDFMIMIFQGEQIVANHTHNLWVETLYMGGVVGVVGLAFYLIVLPLMRFDRTRPHHILLMSFLIYVAFTSALKVPFFSNSLSSVMTLYVLCIFVRDGARRHGQATAMATRDLGSRIS